MFGAFVMDQTMWTKKCDRIFSVGHTKRRNEVSNTVYGQFDIPENAMEYQIYWKVIDKYVCYDLWQNLAAAMKSENLIKRVSMGCYARSIGIDSVRDFTTIWLIQFNFVAGTNRTELFD